MKIIYKFGNKKFISEYQVNLALILVKNQDSIQGMQSFVQGKKFQKFGTKKITK